MLLKKILKYTGISLVSVVGMAVAGIGAVYYSSTLTGKVLSLVEEKVPGLSWDKAEGSLASGVKITNLHYISTNYRYNPETARPADLPESAEIPTLVDVRIPEVSTKIILGCLVRGQICLDQVVGINPHITIAIGDKNRLDIYQQPEIKVSSDGSAPEIVDITNPNPEEDSGGGPPEWLDVIVTNGRVEGLNLVLGGNIGLAQQALNSFLVQHKKQELSEKLQYVPTLEQLSLNSTVPESIFNQWLSKPMQMTLDFFTAGRLHYTPHLYELHEVKVGTYQLDLYSQNEQQAQAVNPITAKTNSQTNSAAETTDKVNAVANSEEQVEQEAEDVAVTGKKNSLKQKTVLSPEIKQLLAKYFNLQADAYSESFQKIGKALQIDYKLENSNSSEDFSVLLPEVTFAEDTQVSDSRVNSTLATTQQQTSQDTNTTVATDSIAQTTEQTATSSASSQESSTMLKQALWQELTGATGEFTFVPATGEGKNLPAAELNKQIQESFSMFKKPLREYILDGTQLKMPVDVKTSQVALQAVDLNFYNYTAAYYLQQARQSKKLKTGAITLADNFKLEQVTLDGDLTPSEANFKATSQGDVKLALEIVYSSRTNELQAALNTQILKLPLVNLPVAVDFEAQARGRIYNNLALVVTNKSDNALVNLDAKFNTAKAYWPLEIKLSLPQFKVNDKLQLSNFDFNAQGHINNLKAALNSNLSLDKQLYYLKGQVVNKEQFMAADLGLVAVQANEQASQVQADLANRAYLHLYSELHYKQELTAQAVAKVNKISLPTLVPNLGFKDLTLNGFLNLGGVYTSQQDWSLFFKNSNFTGTLEHDPFNLSLVAGVDSVHGVIINPLQATYLNNKIHLVGHLNKAVDAELDLALHNLRKVVPNLTIDADVNLAAHGSLDTPSLKGTINVPQVAYKQGTTNLRINKLTGVLDLFLTDVVAGKAEVNLAKSQVNALVINHVKLDFLGAPINKLALDFASNQANLQLNANELSISKDGNVATQLEIKKLDLAVAKLNGLHTAAPFSVEWLNQEKTAKVGNFTLANKQLSLSNQETLTYTPARVRANLALDKFDLSSLAAFMRSKQTRLVGTVSGKVVADLNPTQLDATTNNLYLALQASHIQIFTIANLSPLKVTLSKLNSQAQVIGKDLQANLDVTINNAPLAIKTKISDLYKQQALDGEVKLSSLSLDVIKPLLDNTQQVKGNLYTELDLGGTLKDPLLYGNAGVSQLNVSAVDLPFEVQTGNLDIAFDGKNAQITGYLPTKSTPLQLGGTADWSNMDNIQSEVTLNTKDLKLHIQGYGTVQMDSNIVATYKNNNTDVVGTVELHDGKFYVEAASGVNYAGPSGDVVLLDANGKLPTTNIKGEKVVAKSGGKVNAKIKVYFGNNLVFDSYGVNAKLGGSLAVNYEGKTPSVVGSITIPSGTFVQYGQNLIIQRGTITFNGLSMTPNIYLRAIRNPDFMMDSVTVGVQVSGPATKPTISLFSTPSSLSNSQKINYLLTGSGTDSGDGEVGLQLLTSSITSSFSVIEKIGNTFGIKNLQFSTAKSGEDSQITLSGTVFKRIRLNYAYGIFNSLTEISASYRLLPKVFLRLTRGTSSSIDTVYTTSW